MKRDMNLIKLILKYVESEGDGQKFLEPPEFPDYSATQIEHHMDLCNQAGYIVGQLTGGGIFPRALTWAGYEALDELRNGRSEGH